MVNLDHLAALDLLLWLGTTERAATLACTSQSTISRRSRIALQAFDLRLGRNSDGLWPQGDTSLLALERQVHQRARFQGRQLLRLQVPQWSRDGVLRHLPQGWCTNPALPGLVCDDPVALLRARVIDACLLTPTQVPAAADDLLLLDVLRRPIELAVLDAAAGEPSRSPAGGLHLDLLPFLPRSCRVRSQEWFAALSVSVSEAVWSRAPESSSQARDGMRVAFLTPEMRALEDRPWTVVDAMPPYPYVERLAVLADNAGVPALQQLQERLLRLVALLAA